MLMDILYFISLVSSLGFSFYKGLKTVWKTIKIDVQTEIRFKKKWSTFNKQI